MLAMLIIGVQGWRTLRADNIRNTEVMRKASTFELAVDTARIGQVEFKKQVQEWKDTLLRGNDQAAFDKYSKAFADRSELTQTHLRELKDLFGKLGLDATQVDDAIAAHKELRVKYADALTHYEVANPESAHVVDALVKGMDRPPTKKIDDIVAYVIAQSNQMMATAQQDADLSYRNACILIAVTVVLAIAVGGVITYLLMRSITVPLARAVAIAQTVAAGDLRSDVTASGKDETAQLQEALRIMNDSLAKIVSEVRHGTHEIVGAATEIARGNLDLSGRTEEQASSLEETASAMEQLTATVKQNAANARQANTLAVTASEVARKGGAVVSEVVDTMGSINDSSKKIVDIISVIDGIAFQTNILALNAAVEAARAGEQGRGFAVVAAEVRNLAQRSAAAAKEIKALIGDSVDKVDAGAKLVDQAGLTMNEIVASVKRVTDIIGEISVASDEQTTGLDQINTAITQMDQVTQHNAALVEEAAAAAEALQNQGTALAKAVSIFQLTDEQTDQHSTAPIAKRKFNDQKPASKPVNRPAVAPSRKPAIAGPVSASKAVSSDSWEEF
ncbi:MAG TPA: methyl-accepting chemotaxis protein [Burkholderiaceae bacterium]|nr:methyl-accepting chemotaxis protein [Burkholderiaceae bacterium]